jgi:NADH:ubiquinone oxidoreductase subunit H
MLLYSSALFPALTCDLDVLVFVSLSGLLGCLCVLPMVIVSNRFTSIGSLRQLRALIIADIGLDTALVLLLLWFVSLDTSSNAMIVSSAGIVYLLLFIPIFILVLIVSARAPSICLKRNLSLWLGLSRMWVVRHSPYACYSITLK